MAEQGLAALRPATYSPVLAPTHSGHPQLSGLRRSGRASWRGPDAQAGPQQQCVAADHG